MCVVGKTTAAGLCFLIGRTVGAGFAWAYRNPNPYPNSNLPLPLPLSLSLTPFSTFTPTLA